MKTQIKTAIVFLVLSLVFAVPSVFANEQCLADVNGDGMADPLDVGAVQSRFGSTDSSDLLVYDLNGDGSIDSLDSNVVTTGFGSCTVAAANSCSADVNNDGNVNPLDSGTVQSRFGSTDSSDLSTYDLNGDGAINEMDSGLVLQSFGECSSEEREQVKEELPSVIDGAETENSFKSEKEIKKTVERNKARNKVSSLEISKDKIKRKVVFHNLNKTKIRLN